MKHELLRALESFDDETHVVVRIKTADGDWIELPAFAVEYVPMDEDSPAYVAVRTFP